MLTFNFGDWVFWESYDPPNFLGPQKVTFDGPNRLILINEGETEIDFLIDVYSAWKEWQRDPNHINSKYPLALSVVGGDPLPGSRQLGTTFFIENGWKIRTWEGDHILTISGNVFDRNGENFIIPTILPWTITINLNTSTLVETIIPESTLAQEDIDAIISGVWTDTIDAGQSALDILLAIPDNVWDEIIDIPKSQTAREKLKKIATKTQDIALE